MESLRGSRARADAPAVIVPVYNAVDALTECLESLLPTLRADVPLLLADDASPDPRIRPLLESLPARHPGLNIRVMRQSCNLGFVGNCIAAVDACPGRDVVLLNSDTRVTPGWIEQLAQCAASDPAIATITPWSNNAEICSYPKFCVANPMPEADEAACIADAAAELADEAPVDLPTGVGFAMWIRRSAWDTLGGFDAATFGRGYGEENDFCRRAAAHGWRNVLCPSAYVAHRGHASFAETGHKPGGENLARLTHRYPDYNHLVADFIARDPLHELRARLDEALARRGGRLEHLASRD
ncbi:MAG: glycosyltransferase [Xanthomonadales bacterium]|nr:glycosyltransferase [Xanthomonadales bacterium]